MAARLARIDSTPDLVERVHHALLDAIADGTLAPGQRLTQEDIARQLAVSRQPVLQALRLLHREGLVLDAPGRGVQVAPLDATLIAQVYQVRGAMDVLAARLAAQRRATIDPTLIDGGRRAARGQAVQPMIEADLAFHNAVYDAAANPLIRISAEQHWQHIRRAMGAVLQRSVLRESVWDEHAEIARAIAAGDPEAAAAAMGGHAERASAHLIRQLEPLAPCGGRELPPRDGAACAAAGDRR